MQRFTTSPITSLLIAILATACGDTCDEPGFIRDGMCVCPPGLDLITNGARSFCVDPGPDYSWIVSALAG